MAPSHRHALLRLPLREKRLRQLVCFRRPGVAPQRPATPPGGPTTVLPMVAPQRSRRRRRVHERPNRGAAVRLSGSRDSATLRDQLAVPLHIGFLEKNQPPLAHPPESPVPRGQRGRLHLGFGGGRGRGMRDSVSRTVQKRLVGCDRSVHLPHSRPPIDRTPSIFRGRPEIVPPHGTHFSNQDEAPQGGRPPRPPTQGDGP